MRWQLAISFWLLAISHWLLRIINGEIENENYLLLNWVSPDKINSVEFLLEEEIKMIHRFISTLNKNNNNQESIQLKANSH